MLPHERLDDALNQRRLDLRVEWNDVAEAIGISVRSLLDIRRGRNGPRQLTARAMDNWLDWTPGSVERLLVGGEPTPIGDQSAAPESSSPQVEKGTLRLTVVVNSEEPEPDLPPGGLRNQSERVIWALDYPWQVRWAQIKAAREVEAALAAGDSPAAQPGE